MQLLQISISRLTIAALLSLASFAAVAQDFPTRAIRIISGTQTGTSGDDLSPLKWSSLKYVLTMEDEINGEEEAYG